MRLILPLPASLDATHSGIWLLSHLSHVMLCLNCVLLLLICVLLLLIILLLPVLLLLLCLHCRWLLSKGRQAEAMQLLRRLAASNKTSMPAAALVCSHTQDASIPTSDTIVITDSPFASHMLPPELGKDQGILPCIIIADPDDSSIAGSAIMAFRSSDEASLDAAGATPYSTATAATVSTHAHASVQQEQQLQQQQGLCSLLCQPQLMAASLVLLLSWFTIMLSYYGVALGLGGFPGSL
jgi:hypothetical protein